jgi:hypothetical protein
MTWSEKLIWVDLSQSGIRNYEIEAAIISEIEMIAASVFLFGGQKAKKLAEFKND